MPRGVPSTQTLRHLARLCATEPSPAPTRSLLCAIARHTQTTRPSSSRHLSTSRYLHQTASPSSSTAASTATPEPPPLPNTSSYYTLFPTTLASGPPPTGPFSIPLPRLRREFLQLQAIYHPDKSSSSNPTTTTSLSPSNLIALSSLINNAYRTLSDPLLRAQYLLLHTYSIDVTSEDNSANTTDPETLLDVMDVQESIEAALSEAEIDTLKAENAARLQETVEKMGRAFEHGDVKNARRECIRLKYWRNLQEGLNDWEVGKEVRLIH